MRSDCGRCSMASELLLIVPALLALLLLRRPLAASLALRPVDRRRGRGGRLRRRGALGGQPRPPRGAVDLVAAERGLSRDLPPAAQAAASRTTRWTRVSRWPRSPSSPRPARRSCSAASCCPPSPAMGALAGRARQRADLRGHPRRPRRRRGRVYPHPLRDPRGHRARPASVRTGSLVPPILAHAVLNTITFATVVVTGVEMETETPDAALGTAMLVGGAVLTAIALRHARPPSTAPRDC